MEPRRLDYSPESRFITLPISIYFSHVPQESIQTYSDDVQQGHQPGQRLNSAGDWASRRSIQLPTLRTVRILQRACINEVPPEGGARMAEVPVQGGHGQTAQRKAVLGLRLKHRYEVPLLSHTGPNTQQLYSGRMPAGQSHRVHNKSRRQSSRVLHKVKAPAFFGTQRGQGVRAFLLHE